jgi:O-antigen ligase
MKKLKKNDILYITAIIIPWYGLEIFGVGLLTITNFLVGMIAGIINFNNIKIKLNIYNGILLSYFFSIFLSSFFLKYPLGTLLEIVVSFSILTLLFFIDYKKIDFEKYFVILSSSFFIRTILELKYSFTHLNLWLGKYIDFMRFSVVHFGGDPNNFAFLIISPLIFIYLSKGKKRKVFLLFFLIHFIMVFSRGAILSFTLAIFIYSFIDRSKKIKFILVSMISLIMVLIFLILIGFVNYKVDSLKGKDTSAQSRLQYWESTFNEMKTNDYLIGAGPRTYTNDFSHWAHNSYVNRFYETGILGFLGYILILIIATLFYLKQRNYQSIIFLTFIFASFFVDMYWNSLAWILIGNAFRKIK